MITTSFFELFKIGPGPSSSHTIGPMIAAKKFREKISLYLDKDLGVIGSDPSSFSVKVNLYGALADTGKGHGTHQAILAGLKGQTPISVNIEELKGYFLVENKKEVLQFKNLEIGFFFSDIIFNYGKSSYRHSNTVKFLFLKNDTVALEAVFYSIGGGFIEEEGNENTFFKKRSPSFPYKTMEDFISLQENSGEGTIDILYQNEMAITGLSRKEINKKIDYIIETMFQSVRRGLKTEGVLPGGLNISRRAKKMYQTATEKMTKDDHFLKLNAYALAVSEENAVGNLVVTAPTNGAAGIIPSILYYLEHDCSFGRQKLREGLMVAGLIGFIIKENASISGAELGCMAEIGSASSMGAALFSYAYNLDIWTISTAAEIALEHSLGMTCDPVNGLVQVPCIERNATGVIKSYNAYLLALARSDNPLISLDKVIGVMRETGKDLSKKYKETATGGLAVYGWGNMPGS